MILYEKILPDNERFIIEDDGGNTFIFRIQVDDKDKYHNAFLLRYTFDELKDLFIREFKHRGYNAELLEVAFKKK
jgi:hypothetical protein